MLTDRFVILSIARDDGIFSVTRVGDVYTGKLLRMNQVRELVGKTLYDEWRKHEYLQTVHINAPSWRFPNLEAAFHAWIGNGHSSRIPDRLPPYETAEQRHARIGAALAEFEAARHDHTMALRAVMHAGSLDVVREMMRPVLPPPFDWPNGASAGNLPAAGDRLRRAMKQLLVEIERPTWD